MKRATAYQRKSTFFVHADSETTDGVWILSEPCVALPESTTDHELGATILRALEGSQSGIPHPKHQDWHKVPSPILGLAGMKSWNAFGKGAMCVGIENEGDQITVTPTKNLGPKEGFVYEPAQRVLVRRHELEPLGAVVRRLLAGQPSSTR